MNDPALRAGLFSPDAFVDDAGAGRGADYYDEEYEGGEMDEVFPDVDNDLARQERIKEEIELSKF